MEPAGVSVISHQRSYIKFETLTKKNPSEINGALSEVYGESTVDCSTVSRWVNRFRGGCVSINNEPKSEMSITSTDERSVKLVADVLEEDSRTTYEELSRAMRAKLSQENEQEPT